MRGVRNQLTELISGLAVQDMAPMSLGLSHSLSRYKLKFSAEKVCFLLTLKIYRVDLYHHFSICSKFFDNMETSSVDCSYVNINILLCYSSRNSSQILQMIDESKI